MLVPTFNAIPGIINLSFLFVATNINVHFITPTICLICIFYTTIGGLKAVIWTDAMQFVAMIGAVFAVVWVGIGSVGGFQNIFKIAQESGRLDYE